jgi:hypothetical protein
MSKVSKIVVRPIHKTKNGCFKKGNFFFIFFFSRSLVFGLTNLQHQNKRFIEKSSFFELAKMEQGDE